MHGNVGHGIDLQDRYSAAVTDTPVVGVTLLDPNQRLELSRRQGDGLGTGS